MFTQILNATRKEKGYTAQQMADVLNVTLRTYRHYESGHSTPSIYAVAKIADVLEVTTDYLLGRAADPQLPLKHVDES